MSIGVPSNLVELVQRVSGTDLEAAYLHNSHPFGSEQVPFYWAGALLQASARSEQAAAKNNTLVVVRSAAQRVALHVDEVLGNQEVVVKNLGPQLARRPHRLRAMRAPPRFNGNLAQAFWTLLGGRIRWLLSSFHACNQRVHRQDDKEINHARNQQKRDRGVDEIADRKRRPPNREMNG